MSVFDQHKELSAKLGQIHLHKLNVCTKYQTFAPKWQILSALLLDIQLKILQIRPHQYQS